MENEPARASDRRGSSSVIGNEKSASGLGNEFFEGEERKESGQS